jgi:hypothetical protein
MQVIHTSVWSQQNNDLGLVGKMEHDLRSYSNTCEIKCSPNPTNQKGCRIVKKSNQNEG